MIKKAKVTKKDNVVNFPTKINDLDKEIEAVIFAAAEPLDVDTCLLYTSPSPRDGLLSRMPSSA